MNYAWQTEFYNISLSSQLANGLEFLAQYMTGTTLMGPVDVVKAEFSAAYALASYQKNSHRISLRFDQFEVVDLDGFVFPSGNADKNDSEGTAITVAYLNQLSEQKILGIEYIKIESSREGNEGLGDEDPDDNTLQVMYRITI